MDAAILRPWYVLGAGRRWAVPLVPFYRLFERIAGTRAAARRLGLAAHGQMIVELVRAEENPGQGVPAVEVPQIRGG